jgi:hypothetical protein
LLALLLLAHNGTLLASAIAFITAAAKQLLLLIMEWMWGVHINHMHGTGTLRPAVYILY